MARATGLEPAASGVTGRRSNQLSYARNPKSAPAVPPARCHGAPFKRVCPRRQAAYAEPSQERRGRGTEVGLAKGTRLRSLRAITGHLLSRRRLSAPRTPGPRAQRDARGLGENESVQTLAKKPCQYGKRKRIILQLLRAKLKEAPAAPKHAVNPSDTSALVLRDVTTTGCGLSEPRGRCTNLPGFTRLLVPPCGIGLR